MRTKKHQKVKFLQLKLQAKNKQNFRIRYKVRSQGGLFALRIIVNAYIYLIMKLIRNIVVLSALACGSILQAQQAPEFREVVDFYDRQRAQLTKEFRKHEQLLTSPQERQMLRNDFLEFMLKMDSIQNVAFVNALVRVRIREDLQRANLLEAVPAEGQPVMLTTKKNGDAAYPGGFSALRKHVVEGFYSSAILSHENLIQARVNFVVEPDGSVSSVRADGTNPIFNRQAEIAVYMLPEKFSPALVNGKPVRYNFSIPLAMKFE